MNSTQEYSANLMNARDALVYTAPSGSNTRANFYGSPQKPG